MAKIIHSSIECGYKVADACLHNHVKSVITKCKPVGEENFPPNCPLENTMSIRELSLKFPNDHDLGKAVRQSE